MCKCFFFRNWAIYANLHPLKLGSYSPSEARRSGCYFLPCLHFKEMFPFSLRKTGLCFKTSKKLADLHIFHKSKERIYNYKCSKVNVPRKESSETYCVCLKEGKYISSLIKLSETLGCLGQWLLLLLFQH